MAERTGVEQIVEKVVSQVLDSHVPELRDELVRRVLEELPQATGAAAAGASGERRLGQSAESDFGHPVGHDTTRNLARAAGQHGALQRARGAVRGQGGAATGWQGRGFTKDGDDTIKDFALNVTAGVPEQALRSRMPFSGTTAISIRNLLHNSARRRMTRCWCCPCY